MSIRSDVSRILKFTVLSGEDGTNWDGAFVSLQKEGRLNTRFQWELLIYILKKLEELEKKNEWSTGL